MNTSVGSALLYLARAAAENSTDLARRALYRFGRGAFESDPASAVHDFGPEARKQPELIANAVSTLGSRAEMWPGESLPDVLYGRSGYQFLLDAGVWDEPPLSAFHLGETDESLADVVAEHGVGTDSPPEAPAGHTWWRPSA